MSVASVIRNAIIRLGQKLELQQEEQVRSFWGSIQPKFSRSNDDSNAFGWGRNCFYTLYAVLDDVTRSINLGDTVVFENTPYHVLQREIFWIAREEVYLKVSLQKVQVGGAN